MKLKDVINAILAVAKSQPSIESVFEGDIYTLNELKDLKYSAFVATQGTHTYSEDFNRYNFTLFYVDRLVEDESNVQDVQSTGIDLLSNVIRTLDRLGIEVEGNITFTTFKERFEAVCGGAYCSLTFLAMGEICEDLWNVIPIYMTSSGSPFNILADYATHKEVDDKIKEAVIEAGSVTTGVVVDIVYSALTAYTPTTNFATINGSGITNGGNLIIEGGSGAQGPQGARGARGEKGEKGEQGIQGTQGERGADGAQGERGADGTQGVRGEKGDNGERGADGAQGERGERGEQGIQGTQGAIGAQGERGADGTQGVRGERGEQGAQGARGEKGESGSGGSNYYILIDTPENRESGITRNFNFSLSTLQFEKPFVLLKLHRTYGSYLSTSDSVGGTIWWIDDSDSEESTNRVEFIAELMDRRSDGLYPYAYFKHKFELTYIHTDSDTYITWKKTLIGE